MAARLVSTRSAADVSSRRSLAAAVAMVSTFLYSRPSPRWAGSRLPSPAPDCIRRADTEEEGSVKCGVTTYLWSAEFTDATFDELPDLREWGFDGVEFPLFRPEGFPAAAVRRALESRGLECTTALALVRGLSLITGDPAVRARTIEYLERVIAATADSGSTMLVGPIYSPVGEIEGRRTA